ncbi:MAG TPA: hypothetical protein VFS88_07370 [Micavibrio sp.]|nr:hypothetical protein [Micavibrio sp.]
MSNEYTQQSSGIYKDSSPRKNIIRADAVTKVFRDSGVALTSSGRYVDLDRVPYAAPTPRL